MTITTLPAALPNAFAPANSRPANGVMAQTAVVSLAANPSANDQTELFWLPRGAKIVGAWLNATGMDSNASPTFAVELGVQANNAGDAAVPALIFASAVEAQSAALQEGPEKVPNAAYTHTFNDRTKVALTYTAVAATFVAGTVRATVLYTTPGGTVSDKNP